MTRRALAVHILHDHIVENARDALSTHECVAIRSLILRNVIRGRVAGLMQSQRVTDTSAWLAAYVERVLDCFRGEQPAWRELLMSGGVPYDPLLARLETAVVRVLPAIRARYGRGWLTIEAEELVNDAYVWLRAQHGLLDYSFDEPLDAWFDRVMWGCAKHLYRTHMPISQLDIDEESTRCAPIFGVLPEADLVDERLGLSCELRALIDADRRIITDALSNVRACITARALGVSNGTLYARRKRLIAKLHTRLADDAN
jgi:hypothetical protein